MIKFSSELNLGCYNINTLQANKHSFTSSIHNQKKPINTSNIVYVYNHGSKAHSSSKLQETRCLLLFQTLRAQVPTPLPTPYSQRHLFESSINEPRKLPPSPSVFRTKEPTPSQALPQSQGAILLHTLKASKQSSFKPMRMPRCSTQALQT